MGDRDNKILKELLERRKSAESLPSHEKAKWKEDIDNLDRQINELKIRLGISDWDEDMAMRILREANYYLSMSLCWDGDGKSFSRYIEEDPSLLKMMKAADRAIDNAFGEKSMGDVKKVVEEYKNTYAGLNRVWRRCSEDEGFREILEGEEGYLENPWDS